MKGTKTLGKRVAVITDTNSGFSQQDEKDGFYILPMPFIIGENEYIEGVTLDKELFYKFMEEEIGRAHV